ncbi:hypothetical protein IP97_01475 [Flavobacterium cheniae]|uniref:Uncharacterized protein n=1 Tax=Flavobacterium cheniae TaxID=295428 RepID=A0A562KHR7_9FLAO|nr:hypothetical protein C8D80_1549 [Flavobacterium cheniae]TWH94763.1 hypothetical protein IP97_01475 [Flavobacterium cheniae]
MDKRSYFASENIFFKILFILAFILFFIAMYEYVFLPRFERTKYLSLVVMILFSLLLFRRKFKNRW